jgi:hypothetical protein
MGPSVQAGDPLAPVRKPIARRARIEIPPVIGYEQGLDGNGEKADHNRCNVERFAFEIGHAS